jgi:hypothetical protein
MTNRQAAVLASRIFCVWFIYNAVLSLAALPNLIALFQESNAYSSVLARIGSSGLHERTMMMNVLVDLFRVCVNATAAVFLYRCGPGLIRFLTGDESDIATNEAESL